MVFDSSDSLWEQAAAEVQSLEAAGGEEEEAVSERTVFLMGSKAGVCSLPSHNTDSTCIAF